LGKENPREREREREREMVTKKDKAPGIFLPSSHDICPAPDTHKLSHHKNPYKPLSNSSTPPPPLLLRGEKESTDRERKRG